MYRYEQVVEGLEAMTKSLMHRPWCVYSVFIFVRICKHFFNNGNWSSLERGLIQRLGFYVPFSTTRNHGLLREKVNSGLGAQQLEM